MRGDAPVIISYVELNSLADVSVENWKWGMAHVYVYNNLIFVVISSWAASKKVIS